MAGISLENISKSFGSVNVIDNITLDIPDGEFVVFVGPSGCGKSTTLRMLAGLETPTSGVIQIGGRDVTRLPPGDRDIAMVFQNYALYPHMTVSQNMSFALRLKGLPREEVDARVADAARILHIEPLLDRKPKQLSGGQRQRVAMGRAIVRSPSVFLFDEPLSNLDAQLRGHMRLEIALLQKRLRGTIVYVTHDQTEAMTLADRIVIFDRGVIQQIGTPEEVFERPANLFVARFIGNPTMNVLPCRYDDRAQEVSLIAGDQKFAVPDAIRNRFAPHAGKDLMLGIRPQAFGKKGDHMLSLKATAEVVEYLGTEVAVVAKLAGSSTDEVTAIFSTKISRDALGEILLSAPIDEVHLFDAATGAAVGS